MNTFNLFIEFSHRLKKYSDVCVLMALLSEHSDVTENKTSSGKISFINLQEAVSEQQVRRSLVRLSEVGLIKFQIHANTRTHITVNREAVLTLLRTPLPSQLPGLGTKTFPFLDAWKESMSTSKAVTDIPITATDESENHSPPTTGVNNAA